MWSGALCGARSARVRRHLRHFPGRARRVRPVPPFLRRGHVAGGSERRRSPRSAPARPSSARWSRWAWPRSMTVPLGVLTATYLVDSRSAFARLVEQRGRRDDRRSGHHLRPLRLPALGGSAPREREIGVRRGTGAGGDDAPGRDAHLAGGDRRRAGRFARSRDGARSSSVARRSCASCSPPRGPGWPRPSSSASLGSRGRPPPSCSLRGGTSPSTGTPSTDNKTACRSGSTSSSSRARGTSPATPGAFHSSSCSWCSDSSSWPAWPGHRDRAAVPPPSRCSGGGRREPTHDIESSPPHRPGGSVAGTRSATPHEREIDNAPCTARRTRTCPTSTPADRLDHRWQVSRGSPASA